MMDRGSKRAKISRFLDLDESTDSASYVVLESVQFQSYTRELITYLGSEEDDVRAYLFRPLVPILGSVLVHHQHHGERHLGKSEVAGLLGDPLQAFGPALAAKGILVLAPDSICFEDRRRHTTGVEISPDPDDDMLQHYNEMAYRLLEGSTLMKKVLDDARIAFNLLLDLDESGGKNVGVLGHSYGGNTVLFQSALDTRIQFSCTSGAACSYRQKMSVDTGIELAMAIPGFLKQWDVDDLLSCICPRHLLVVSSSDDEFSQDAPTLVDVLRKEYRDADHEERLVHNHSVGPHALDQDRFDVIVGWFEGRYASKIR